MKTIGIYKFDKKLYSELIEKLEAEEINIKPLKDSQTDDSVNLYIYNVEKPEEFEEIKTDRPFIIVSSLQDSKYLIKSHKLGALDYISKPFIDIERIVKRIQRFLENGNSAAGVVTQQMNKVDRLIELEVKRAHRGTYPVTLASVIFEANLNKETVIRLIDKMKTALRDSDSCMPYSDSNIMIILPFTDKPGAVIVARKIADLLNSLNYKSYCLCSQYPEDGDKREKLIENLGKSVDTRNLYK